MYVQRLNAVFQSNLEQDAHDHAVRRHKTL